MRVSLVSVAFVLSVLSCTSHAPFRPVAFIDFTRGVIIESMARSARLAALE
jgi:hypothetical protein